MTRSRLQLLAVAPVLLNGLACASPIAQGAPPVPTDRAALLSRMHLADGVCRVYADYGSIPNSATYLEVLPSGEPASNNSVVLSGDTVKGRINHRPVHLQVEGDQVVGTYGARAVRFAIERTAEETNVRASPAWHLIVGEKRIALQAPSAAFEALVDEGGQLTGAVRARGEYGKVRIQTAHCGLDDLRGRPELLVLLFGAFEGTLAPLEPGASARDAMAARR